MDGTVQDPLLIIHGLHGGQINTLTPEELAAGRFDYDMYEVTSVQHDQPNGQLFPNGKHRYDTLQCKRLPGGQVEVILRQDNGPYQSYITLTGALTIRECTWLADGARTSAYSVERAGQPPFVFFGYHTANYSVEKGGCF